MVIKRHVTIDMTESITKSWWEWWELLSDEAIWSPHFGSSPSSTFQLWLRFHLSDLIPNTAIGDTTCSKGSWVLPGGSRDSGKCIWVVIRAATLQFFDGTSAVLRMSGKSLQPVATRPVGRPAHEHELWIRCGVKGLIYARNSAVGATF